VRVEIIGVYPVEDAPEPCHLVELWVAGAGHCDLDRVMQETPGQPRSNWQAPYDEHILSPDGRSGHVPDAAGPFEVAGEVRLAFFFHYLTFDRPLLTGDGPLPLPSSTDRPPRLSFLHYQPP
jgi:hypothetical protein